VAEGVGVELPLAVALGGVDEELVEGQRLLGGGADRPGRESLVEVDAVARRLGQRVGPAAIDHLEEVLLVRRRQAGIEGQTGLEPLGPRRRILPAPRHAPPASRHRTPTPPTSLHGLHPLHDADKPPLPTAW